MTSCCKTGSIFLCGFSTLRTTFLRSMSFTSQHRSSSRSNHFPIGMTPSFSRLRPTVRNVQRNDSLNEKGNVGSMSSPRIPFARTSHGWKIHHSSKLAKRWSSSASVMNVIHCVLLFLPKTDVDEKANCIGVYVGERFKALKKRSACLRREG